MPKPSPFAALLLVLAAGLCAVLLMFCGPLPSSAVAGIDQAVADACPLEAMIPFVGAEAVLMCPMEDAAVASALAADTAPPASSPGSTSSGSSGTSPAADAGPPPVLKSLVVKGRRVGVRIRRTSSTSPSSGTSMAPSTPLTVSSSDAGAGRDGGP